MSIIIITLMILFALLSGFFSASQTALLSLSSMQAKSYKQSLDKRKNLIAYLISRPRDLLVTLFMLDTFVNLMVQNFASNLFGQEASWALKVGVPLVLTLVVGEIIPKALAFAHKTKVAYKVAPIIAKIEKVVGPIRSFLTLVTTYVSHALFFYLKKEEEISEEELHHVLKTSEKHGILSKDESELIDGYLTLQEVSVKELMRPRQDALYYNLQEPITKLTHLFSTEGCTRLPVCSGEFEDVLGIISARDYFLNRSQIQSGKDVLKIVSAPYYIPETTKARLLLKQFASLKESFALVINEYGSVVGLITNEDLVETVVGEIADRRDEKKLYTQTGKDVIIASGKLELSEFKEIFHHELISLTNQVTVGGWLTEKLGEIPKVGTQYKSEGFLFKVLAAEPNRVRRIYIRKEAPHAK